MFLLQSRSQSPSAFWSAPRHSVSWCWPKGTWALGTRLLLQITFNSCVIGTTFSRENGRSLPWAARKWLKYENKLSDRMMKLLLNSVIAKYHDLSVSRRSIICLGLRLRQIIDLFELTTDNSRYFAQPRPIIVNYSCHSWEPGWYHEKVLWCGTLLFTLLFTFFMTLSTFHDYESHGLFSTGVSAVSSILEADWGRAWYCKVSGS